MRLPSGAHDGPRTVPPGMEPNSFWVRLERWRLIQRALTVAARVMADDRSEEDPRAVG
jgi:hypothetical protein